jgi:hypothetical protein
VDIPALGQVISWIFPFYVYSMMFAARIHFSHVAILENCQNQVLPEKCGQIPFITKVLEQIRTHLENKNTPSHPN